jgi:hypothetical protein
MVGRVFQLKATVVGTKPPVWRRVLVEESGSLLDLHDVPRRVWLVRLSSP